jgi:cell fate (sporulation/competence/biofilm development) regulator YlbF (YheA/YmcA/DUF963 family)
MEGMKSMLMTDEWVTILERAEELADYILSSDVIEEYNKCYQEVYSNDVLVKSIKEFTEMKERYDEVQRFGRYHPDYSHVMKEIRLQKRALDMNEQIAALRLAENDVQFLYDEVGSIIAKSVSDSVKVPAGSAFFADSSCGSGCGSGGSCSCSA